MPKIAIIVNTARFFISHRLHLAQGLKKQGFEVHVICPEADDVVEIKKYGFEVQLWNITRSRINPFAELLRIFELAAILRRIKPDILHSFTMKCNVYGTLAALLSSVPKTINTVTGLGHTFISESIRARIVRKLLSAVFPIIYKRKNVQMIFQNQDDFQLFVSNGWASVKQSCIVRGTGVDTSRFYPARKNPEGPPVVVFSARLLSDKGVFELLTAATRLCDEGLKFNLKICGEIDAGNPSSLTLEQKTLHLRPQIEFLGHVHDMSEVYNYADIACLPSYREGIPLALMEACASGCAIVTTDVPGCREVVTDGENGILVKPRDVVSLYGALKALIQNPTIRSRMSIQSRKKAEIFFDKEKVIQQCIDIYDTKKSIEAA